MRYKLFSENYKFIIALERYEMGYSFEILSLYKTTGQKSVITNLNFIISELISPILEAPVVNSTIFLNLAEGIKLFQETVFTFTNERWMKLLEKYLDEDRNYGGWNSEFEFS